MTNLNQVETFAGFHKALAEPIRLRILALLNQRDSLCVCDLVTVLGLSQSTVSRHLSYLKNQNVVRSWREANWIHYALQTAHPLMPSLQLTLEALQTDSAIQADQSSLQHYEQTPRVCMPR